MKYLVTRYVTAEQRKRDNYQITEDDVMEIRQDISKLRYEIIDILGKNGMKTPNLPKNDGQCNNFFILLSIYIKRRRFLLFLIGIIFWKTETESYFYFSKQFLLSLMHLAH